MKLKLFVFTVISLFFLIPTAFAQIPQNPEGSPDLNIRLRFGPGRTDPLPSPNLLDSTLGTIAKYHFGSDSEIDAKAPQLDTMFDGAAGAMTNLYQLYDYNGTTLIPSTGTSNWGATLVGFGGAGTAVKVPQSGYNIGGGYQVTILYLDEDAGDITLTYTAGEQTIVIGYSMHFLNLDIDPTIAALYQQGRGEGKLVALPCGYQLGTIRSELDVSIRDTGTFMDPRSAYDWWQSTLGLSTSPLVCDASLEPTLIIPGRPPGSELQREYTLQEVACNATVDPEFHSLRPYPASPTCDPAPDGVWMCGNDLVLRQTHTVTPGDGNCRVTGPNTQDCDFNVSGSATVYLDLLDADFPIAGNTEDVPNAISSSSSIPDGARVNEYVSWYLNGVISRAEEFFADADNPTGLFKIINYSGPLRRLLPRTIQTIARSSLQGLIGNGIHNQIIECGGDSPVPCYDTPDNAPQRYRITDQGTENQTQFQYTPYSSTEDKTGQISLYEKNQSFPNITDISFTPTTNVSENKSTKELYFPHLAENKTLSELLQRTYLPGEYKDRGTEGSFDDAMPNIGCTYVETGDNQGDSLYGENIREGSNSYLEIDRGGTVVRENRLQGEVTYNANFSCTLSRGLLEFQCYQDCTRYWRDAGLPVPPGNDFSCQQDCTPTPECSVPIPVPLTVEVRTPDENEDIFDRLVGAEMSIFRRVFPKTGVDTPVEEIEDIPGKTNVTYAGENFSASGEVAAGNPDGSRAGSSAELYFPHLGSIQEYFLHGIQEALRPQGIGLPSGNTPPGGSELVCQIQNSGIQSKELQNLIVEAAQWARIPTELLTTVIRGEGCGGGDPRNDPTGARTGGICQYTDAQILSFSAPGAEDPRNCPGGGTTPDGQGKGPLGMYHDSVAWTPWANAVNMATGENRTPNICNIKDATYAAAYLLSASYDGCANPGFNVSSAPSPNSWTQNQIQSSLTAWGQGCNVDICSGVAGDFYCSAYDIWADSMSVSCTGGGGQAASCSQGINYCDPAFLAPYFGGDMTKAQKASIICNRESGSSPIAKNDGCLRGETVDYSIGLFQINLLAHCPAAGAAYTWEPPSCSFANMAALATCEAEMKDPIKNIEKMVQLSNNGTNWGPWSAATACNIN